MDQVPPLLEAVWLCGVGGGNSFVESYRLLSALWRQPRSADAYQIDFVEAMAPETEFRSSTLTSHWLPAALRKKKLSWRLRSVVRSVVKSQSRSPSLLARTYTAVSFPELVVNSLEIVSRPALKEYTYSKWILALFCGAPVIT